MFGTVKNGIHGSWIMDSDLSRVDLRPRVTVQWARCGRELRGAACRLIGVNARMIKGWNFCKPSCSLSIVQGFEAHCTSNSMQSTDGV